MARRFGHTIVPTTPALAPLLLSDAGGFHTGLSGVSQTVGLELRMNGRVQPRTSGSMLWTHFGISGPAALDMSRHWLRARTKGSAPELLASFSTDDTFETLETRWIDSRPAAAEDINSDGARHHAAGGAGLSARRQTGAD